MAVVTYLIRMLPFVLFRKEIKSTFIKSFLYYVPYAVLGAMTVPWIFYATDSFYTALAGFLAALITALQNRSLLTVAACACIAALVVSLVVGV
jgi:branched-subunit amino acid transport protein